MNDTEAKPFELTVDQVSAIEGIIGKWATVGKPQWVIGGGGAVAVHVTGKSGASMWLCIEPDGYTHS